MAVTVRSNRLKDIQATCLAYDAVSGNVILPGRRAFMFVPLTDFEPPQPARHTLRQAAVADATRIYCNPESPSLFAIARGQSLELYEFNRNPGQTATELCSKKMEIQAHSKTVDDFSWCPTVSNWLVSCSRDQYAILWDVSRSEAVVNFRATSPFSCCCWLYTGKTSSSSITNAGSEKLSSPLSTPQMSGYVVVTTADSRLLFWDVRAGSRPAIVVQAHALRIHALDAGSASNEQYQLVTAADGDARMALWDVRNLDRKISSIDSPFGNQAPRRIRFSPSGGMLLVTASTMPRPALIEEPRAAVISLTESTTLMLHGHMDHVYDAIWPSGDMVITWSQDFYLRQFQLATRPIATAAQPSNDSSILAGLASSASDVPAVLSRESTPSTPPMLRPSTSQQMNQSISESSAATSVPSSMPTLLPLVSPQPAHTIPQPPPLPTQVMSTTNLAGSGTPAVQFAIAPLDYMIPSPRTAGARFCPAGFLVSLHRLYELKQRPNDRALADFHKSFTAHSTVAGRPRRPRHTSLSRSQMASGDSTPVMSGYQVSQSVSVVTAQTGGIIPYGAISPGSGGAGSAGHHHHHHQYTTQQSITTSASSNALILSGGSSSALSSDNQRQHSVLIYSVNALLKCSREFAIECKLDWSKPAECCRENVEIAMSFDRPDMAQAFNVAALVLEDTTFLTKPDLVGCIGRDALIRMFTHYVKQGCLQDAAILAFFLSFTGIDLNNTPDDLDSNQLSESQTGNTYQPDSRTPPLDQMPPGSQAISLVTPGITENQTAEDFVMYDHSYYNTVGPSFLRTQHAALQVSSVRRSSSCHDVQNSSPSDNALNGESIVSSSGEARSRHASGRILVFSPPKGHYANRLLQMAATKRRNQQQQQEGRRDSVDGTPYSSCTESERIQMSVVLRCYATQLYAWRLHDRRTAILRPLNAVSAGQLSTDEQSSLQPKSTGINVGYYHQASVDVSLGNNNNTTANKSDNSQTTPIPIVVAPNTCSPSQSFPAQPSSNCSVCDRPIRGLATICVACGHGGHAVHIRDFFATTAQCPAGCGCKCPNLQPPNTAEV